MAISKMFIIALYELSGRIVIILKDMVVKTRATAQLHNCIAGYYHHKIALETWE